MIRRQIELTGLKEIINKIKNNLKEVKKMYKINFAEKKDMSALIELSRRVIRENYSVFLGEELVENFIESGMADDEVISNFETVLVLKNEEEIIGFCIWKEELLHLLMIEPKYQGKGAGTYFITEMCREKNRKYSNLYLESFEGNSQANNFYEKNGWTAYKTELIEGLGINKVFYKKIKTV